MFNLLYINLSLHIETQVIMSLYLIDFVLQYLTFIVVNSFHQLQVLFFLYFWRN